MSKLNHLLAIDGIGGGGLLVQSFELFKDYFKPKSNN